MLCLSHCRDRTIKQGDGELLEDYAQRDEFDDLYNKYRVLYIRIGVIC